MKQLTLKEELCEIADELEALFDCLAALPTTGNLKKALAFISKAAHLIQTEAAEAQ